MNRVPGPRTAHLCVDMQRMFSEESPWHMPWMDKVVPHVVELTQRHPERTIFTRFIPPPSPEDVPGAWRAYFQRWEEMTLDRMDRGLLGLVEPLQRYVPPARIVNKRYYSAFRQTYLRRILAEGHYDSLVISGGETDVCVLATVMAAIDLGFFVFIPDDAICSSNDRFHDCLRELYDNRFTSQIEMTTSEMVLATWV